MIKVILSADEEILAHRIGLARSAAGFHKYDKAYQKMGFHDSVARDAEAVGSEMAVAKWLGVKDFMPTVDSFKHTADIGKGIEVKWTKWHDGHMIIKPSDRDSDIAVLCVGTSPEYFIKGWLPISMMKRARYKSTKNESWWVAQEHLQPPETFMRSVHASAAL